jgi:Bacteriocin-protection, YdeI or OmpD-Associated/Domain of unknown function (DUF1905)
VITVVWQKIMRFRAKIEINNINPYVHVDEVRATRLKKGWRKPLPVILRVNGQPDVPWRTNMMPFGDGGFYLYLHGEMRKSSTSKVGDTVMIDLAFDDTYQTGPTHPLPDWFYVALKHNKDAEKNWQNLIPSQKKEILRYFYGLKTEEAKMRNLNKAIYVLAGGKGRFMARYWN